jgi:hypothetical protein
MGRACSIQVTAVYIILVKTPKEMRPHWRLTYIVDLWVCTGVMWLRTGSSFGLLQIQ